LLAAQDARGAGEGGEGGEGGAAELYTTSLQHTGLWGLFNNVGIFITPNYNCCTN